MMPNIRKSVPFAFALLAAACTTIKNARDAQTEMAPLADPYNAGQYGSTVSLEGFRLPDFVDFALTNRPEVISAALAVEERFADLESVESGRPFMPNLSVSASYGQSTANGGSHFSWRNSGKMRGSVGLDMLLVDFGRYDAEFREACERLMEAEFEYAETKLAVFEDVAASYFTVLLDNALLDVARTNEWECMHHLSQASNRFESGEAKLLDVLRARLDLSEAVQLRISASNGVATAGAEFLKALGLSADRVPPGAAANVWQGGLDTMLMEFERSSIPADAALFAARTNSPALMAKRAKLKAAIDAVDWTVADMFPELRFSSSFNFADPAWNWNWAFEAAQSLFTGWRKTAAVDSAVARMRSAGMDVEAAEQAFSRDISVAVATRDDSAASLRAARVSVREARENLRVANEQYKVGEASRIDFADAVADYAAALGDRVKAFYGGQIAEVRLIRLSGSDPMYHHREIHEERK